MNTHVNIYDSWLWVSLLNPMAKIKVMSGISWNEDAYEMVNKEKKDG